MHNTILKKILSICILFGALALIVQFYAVEDSYAGGIYPYCSPAASFYNVCLNKLDGNYYCMCPNDDRFLGDGPSIWQCGFDASSCYPSPYTEAGYYSQGYYQSYYQGTYATPTPVRYTITGKVWVDSDGDGDRDTEWKSTTNPARLQLEGFNGGYAPYTVSNLTAGSRQLRFTIIPDGYRLGQNEDGNRSTSVGPSKSYNFLIEKDVYLVYASTVEDTNNDGVGDATYGSATFPARVNLEGHGGYNNAHTWPSVAPGTYTLNLGVPTGYTKCTGEDGNRSVTVGPNKSYHFCIKKAAVPTNTPTPTKRPTPTPTKTPTPPPGVTPPTKTPTKVPTAPPGSTNLVATAPAATGTMEVNQPITLKGTIGNNSSLSSGVASLARFCVFPGGLDTTERQSCFASGSGKVGSDRSTKILAAGETVTFNASTTYSNGTAGQYTMYICADATNVINESDDTAADNCASKTFILDPAVTPPPPGSPNLRGSNIQPSGTLLAPDTYETGKPISLQGTILNNGSTTTGIGSTSRFCVFNGGVDATERQQCYDNTTPGYTSNAATGVLAAGNSQSVSAGTPYMPIVDSDFTIYLCADATKAVTEAIETASDNCFAKTVSSITPTGATYSVDGRVFIDNGDHKYGAGDTPYTAGSLIIKYGPGVGETVPTDPSDGTYFIDNLPEGTYTIELTSVPAGYSRWPTTGRIQVDVGAGCDVTDTSTGGSCDGGDNVVNIDFALLNANPWIQADGLDVRFDGGKTNVIPQANSCSQFALSPSSGTTPGVWFNGDSTPDFGTGAASDGTKGWNWRLGNPSYVDNFPAGPLKTSFSNLETTIESSGTSIKDLAPKCGGGTCTLDASYDGPYRLTSGNIDIASGSIGSNQKVVLLVNGDIHIKGNIDVAKGGYLLIVSSKDIYFDKVVGNTSPSCSTSPEAIEGTFVANKNIHLESVGANCSSGSDKQLSIQGSLITNAAGTGGSLDNRRSLCAENLNFPTLRVTERPDFILNAPDYITTRPTIWKEVAP